MDQNVEFATEGLVGPGKGRVELLVILHVTWEDRGVGYLGCQFTHVLLHAILVRKSQASTFAGKGLGNRPANGTMIGNAENKRVFCFKQGHVFPPLRLLLSPLYDICWCLSSQAKENRWLPFNGIAPANPPVHAISQVIDLIKTCHQRNLGGRSTSIAHGTDKDDIFVFRNVQIFECPAERVDAIKRHKRCFGDVTAVPLIRLAYINYMSARINHTFGIVGTNGGIWKCLFLIISVWHHRTPSSRYRTVPARGDHTWSRSTHIRRQ